MLLLLLKVHGQGGDWDIEKVMDDKEFEEVTDLTEVKEVTEVVLYCDRVVQLVNRTDESQETCRSAYRRGGGAGSYFCPSRLERAWWGHYHSADLSRPGRNYPHQWNDKWSTQFTNEGATSTYVV